jgi:hypothetical protein
MMTKDTTFNVLRAAVFAAAVTVAGGMNLALAQTQTPPPKASATAPANLLSLGEIESRLAAEGIKIKEIEVRDLLLEIEGYDAQGREIDLVIDRRTGETLSHKFDN